MHWKRVLYTSDRRKFFAGSSCDPPPCRCGKTGKNDGTCGESSCDRRRCAWSGSCLGTEKSGVDVQVLEAAPILMGRQLDGNASDILRMFAEKSGVKISTGVSVEAVEGDGHVSGVRLSDGPGDSCGSCRCIGGSACKYSIG